VSHLDYYIKHNIAPVHYDLSNLSAHFQRREALYRTIGLLPLAFKGARVLEVAAGTGQNSLYVSGLGVDQLTLLEPNPAGIRTIRESFQSAAFPHATPKLIEAKLEDYEAPDAFDIVLCENWLGSSPHERALLKKLAGFVAPRGVLVVTCVSPTGFLPNVIRRALAAKLTAGISGFSEKTATLVRAYAPHLATIAGMTRSAVDWVQDNMLNPAYFDLCLTLPMVIQDLGRGFQAAGVSPDFRQDWRWFKAVCGDEFDFNQNLLNEYFRVSGMFLDYRRASADSNVGCNREFDRLALQLVSAVRQYEDSLAGDRGKSADSLRVLLGQMNEIKALMGRHSEVAVGAIAEALALLEENSLTPGMVSGMPAFSGWFGRETIYLSLERTHGSLVAGAGK
jgi:ubiquinone/menaquinone biosynthesis C-methylase UbiE